MRFVAVIIMLLFAGASMAADNDVSGVSVSAYANSAPVYLQGYDDVEPPPWHVNYVKNALIDAYRHYHAGSMVQAIKTLTQKQAGVGIGGDKERAQFSDVRLTLALADLIHDSKGYDVAQEYYDKVLGTLVMMPYDPLWKYTHYRSAENLVKMQRYRDAIAVLDVIGDSDVTAWDLWLWKSLAVKTYAYLSLGQRLKAKDVALRAWHYGRQHNVDSPLLMNYYTTVIAVGEHAGGDPAAAKKWDQKLKDVSLSTKDASMLITARAARAEQQGDTLNALVSYVALYEKTHHDFSNENRKMNLSNGNIWSDLDDYPLTNADHSAVKMKQKIEQQHTYYHSYVAMCALGVLFSCLVVWAVLYKEYKRDSLLRRFEKEDPLTHSPNRPTVTGYASTCLKSAGRASPKGFGIALVGVDNLKHINTTYGYHVGDAVLCHFYQVASRLIRHTDMLGRYTDGSFLLVLPNVNEQDMRYLFERISDALKASPYVFDDAGRKSIYVTISMGATSYLPSPLLQRKPPSLETLVSMADDHACMAKRLGRNQIVIA